MNYLKIRIEYTFNFIKLFKILIKYPTFIKRIKLPQNLIQIYPLFSSPLFLLSLRFSLVIRSISPFPSFSLFIFSVPFSLLSLVPAAGLQGKKSLAIVSGFLETSQNISSFDLDLRFHRFLHLSNRLRLSPSSFVTQSPPTSDLIGHS